MRDDMHDAHLQSNGGKTLLGGQMRLQVVPSREKEKANIKAHCFSPGQDPSKSRSWVPAPCFGTGSSCTVTMSSTAREKGGHWQSSWLEHRQRGGC